MNKSLYKCNEELELLSLFLFHFFNYDFLFIVYHAFSIIDQQNKTERVSEAAMT